MVLEDLDSSDYPARKERVTTKEIICCLDWLARSHEISLDEEPKGRWKTGTYWHLNTRPDELETIQEGSLKQAASILDQVLSEVLFQTLSW